MILRSHLYLIFIFFFQNLTVLAENIEIDSLLQRIESTEDNILKCDLLNKIAYEYLGKNDNKAISYAAEAFRISFNLEYNNGLARSYFIQGMINEDLCKYEIALDNLFSSLIIYKHLKNEDKIAEINYHLGRICKTIGNYEKSLEYCLDALRIRENQELPLEISKIYNTIGSVYKYIGNYDQSLNYYFKCRDIEKEHRRNGVSSSIYNNIGIIYNRQGKHQEALEYYSKSLKIRERNRDSMLIASSFNNIGLVYLDLRILDSAILFLSKSKEIKEKYGDQESLINVYLSIAEYYYQSKNYKQSIDYVWKALPIAKNLKISQSISTSYEILKNIYQDQKQYEQALEYHIKYTQLNDSLINTEKSMGIAQLEILYKNELDQIEHKLNDQRKMFLNIALYGMFFFLLVILIFIYKNQKSKLSQHKLHKVNLEMEKNRLTTELETKNREITRNIIHLTEKNELLLNLTKTLHNLKSNLKNENRPLIQSVINKMKASSNNKIWDEFEVHFINVHDKFYENLNHKHSNLSQNEKRLAAFLKLNMTTKEISMITKQSVQSITVARTRLRKKLNLSNTDINLVSYLEQF